MKVTVCQLHDERALFAQDWEALVEHVRAQQSALVLLPEMPFCRWFGDSRNFDAKVWEAAVRAHDEWQLRLAELAPAMVLGSRPVDFGNERYNEGFVWDGEQGIRAAHAKAYLPDEEGVWEASWYHAATPDFTPLEMESLHIGFLICTELWRMEEARLYGEEGVQVLVTPRATGGGTADKWLAGGRVAAILAGAYGLSSNRIDEAGAFGGQGWIIGPDGDVLALTSREQPYVSLDLDMTLADQAKATYPRYALARPAAGARKHRTLP